ncbi:MAG: hypothetical protein U1E22_09525, partial [Coriobacteriia bacterium]|nr:hypothetical protein [Coriobacteriia bacterium]
MMDTRTSFVAGFVVLGAMVVSACGSTDDSNRSAAKAHGSEGGECYGNGTCDLGLTCLSNRCVNAGTGGTGGVSGTGGAAGANNGGSAGSGGGSAGVAGSAGVSGSGGVAGSAGVSGSGGVAGSAGVGGTADCSSCGSLEQCFNNQYCVAKLVPITGGYSIDATEVTRDQYAAWLATNPDPTTQTSPECSWNTVFEPERTSPDFGCTSEVWPPGAKGDHPVV